MTMTPAKHGTVNAYVNRGCRCEACRRAHSDYQRERRPRRYSAYAERFDHLRDLLIELAPDGLTDDCPARRNRTEAA